jgi:hypothetical protein
LQPGFKLLDGFLVLSHSGVGFASEWSGAVLEELGLPLVEHRGMNLVFVAEVDDGCSVDQMASKDGHFLIRRVLITSLGHDENLLSNDSLFEKGFSPLSLGAKQHEALQQSLGHPWAPVVQFR